MKTGLSEQQELLLLMACRKNSGQLSMSLAEQLYSSRNSAKNAVTKLEALDFIERTAPGYFRVVKLTNDVKQELRQGDEGSEA